MESPGRAYFYLVARGSARLEVDGEEVRHLSVGDAVFIPHGTPHTVRDAPSTKPRVITDGSRCVTNGAHRLGGAGATTSLVTGYFELDGRLPALLESMPTLLLLTPDEANAGPWRAIVQLLLAESASPGPASTIVLQRLADVLFVQALRSLSAKGPCKHKGLGALADPAVHQALGLMHAKVAEPWTVAALASRVGLSRSAFAERFTERVGEPPLQYLARWRMARAAELLRTSDEGIGEIAARVGYESVPSFSKAFVRWQGTRPGALRRRFAGARERRAIDDQAAEE